MTKPLTEIAERETLINLLKEFDNRELGLALVYAKNLQMYGIDVGDKWETATQQSAALSKAYRDGYYAGYEKGRDEKSNDRHLKYAGEYADQDIMMPAT